MSINIKDFHEFMSHYLRPSESDGITFSSINILYNERQKRSGNPNLAYSGTFTPLVELYIKCSGKSYEIENRNRVRKLKGWAFRDPKMLELASLLENGVVSVANQTKAGDLYQEIKKGIEDRASSEAVG